MEVKEKNKKLLIVVGVLLLFGGVSLAYFVSNILINGKGANTKLTTAVIKGARVDVEGVLEFEDLEILPGHKTVSAIKVTATGNNELIPFNLIWKGTNSLTTPLNYTVYKTSEEIEVSATCEEKKKAVGSVTQISEECNISNIDRLGTEIASGRINKNDSKVILAGDEFITATSTGDVKYYYVILEYPNLDEPQNYDLEGSLDGEVTVEESSIRPDINILAAYVQQEGGEYEQANDMPQEGYQLNVEKSTCSNGATPTGMVPNITINNLNKSGTSCYLYFDKKESTASEAILGNITVNEGTPTFSNVAESDEGVYKVSDGMYGGTSYYWRGAVTNNYVKFGGFCWRIIRINGDGSMRLIYDGTTCHANGTSTSESIAVASTAYNTSYNNSSYVGWTYTAGSQRTLSGTASNAKTQLESWYNSNLASQASKIADGKYCNDRNVGAKYSEWGGTWATTWSATGTRFAYAGIDRLWNKYQPTLSCPTGDVYTLKVGLITADEVEFAGGKNANNTSYYLYNGQNYWTMSPTHWGGPADVFRVGSNGFLATTDVNNTTPGLRPVINLKADTLFAAGGNGTQSNPYVVQ